ncbi:MAG: DUF362 domain-containing protein [Candidatus Bathyarchaeia archaeon]
MNGSVVALLKGTDGKELAYKALSAIYADEVVSIRKKFLVKVNITIMKTAAEGITTDPMMTEGIIEYLKDHGAKDVAIAEGGGCDVTRAYQKLGFDEIASRQNVRLIDLNREDGVLKKVPQPHYISEFWIAKPVLEYDCLISAPKLKIHALDWQVTLAMKNLMGLLARGKRGSIHKEDRGIVDLLQLVKPDISVIDGIVGGEGHELWSKPVKMNVIIAGKDCVATDAVGAAVMGFSEHELPRHIRLSQGMGFGTCDLSNIKLVGDASIDEVKKNFKRSGSHRFWGVIH